ncbi:MAG: thiolase family protein [Acidimicrobiales bacterium]|nr:thiolase family protein [Acidimicrobiales bacterium]
MTARTAEQPRTAEDHCAVSGIGISRIGRRLGVDPLVLTAQAAMAAIRDAGLTAADIDGLSTYPGATWPTPGITGAGCNDVVRMLGIRPAWHTGGGEVPGQLGAVVNAVMAVASGLATHVLCFRTVWESTAQQHTGRAAALGAKDATGGVDGYKAVTLPFGIGYACEGAMIAQRYFHDTGTAREQLAQIALVARANAAGNPLAVYRDPLTLDDYLSSRMISDPLCLYDCDPPADGSIAFVVSRRDAVASDRPMIRIEAVGSALGMERCGEMMWSRTDLTPADVDTAQLYDGWSILALEWLEALGLCPAGEGGRFVEGGRRIALDGELPLNTGGGQLSGGRLHGFVQLWEACIQLRGEGGARQMESRPTTAVAATGAASFTGCVLVSTRS